MRLRALLLAPAALLDADALHRSATRCCMASWRSGRSSSSCSRRTLSGSSPVSLDYADAAHSLQLEREFQAHKIRPLISAGLPEHLDPKPDPLPALRGPARLPVERCLRGTRQRSHASLIAQVMFRVASGSFLSSIASHVGSVALLWSVSHHADPADVAGSSSLRARRR